MAVKPSSNNRFGRGSLVSDIAGVSKTNAAKKMTAEDIIKKKQEAAAAKETVIEETTETKAEFINPLNNQREAAVVEQVASVQPQSDVPKNSASEAINSVTQTTKSAEYTNEISAQTTKQTDINEGTQPNVPMQNQNTPVETPEPAGIQAPFQASVQTPVQAPGFEQLVTQQMHTTPNQQEQPPVYGNPYTQQLNQQTGYGYNQYNQYQPYAAQNYGNYSAMTQQMANPYGNAPVNNPNGEFHKTTDYNMFEDYPDINVRLPLKTGGDREMLKKSIMESGIADPIIVAPVQDVIKAFTDVQFPLPIYPPNVQFIIIAGQNRRSLAKETGIELPFIIKRGLTKEQMDTIGLDTNLLNRQFSAMKPSEQVYIVNRRRALFEQNNTRNIRGKLSEITGYEKTYIYQLLSLVHVKKELLTDFVDPGYISVSGITHLVTVPFDNQERLYDFLMKNGIKKVMANQMKALLQDTTTPWNDTYLTNIMFPDKKKYSNITLRPDQYQGIIPDEDLPRASEIILIALKEYYQK